MEQHFQDVAQKAMHNKNLDYFAAHFAKHFIQNPIPQQYRKIMSFGIFYTVNSIGSIGVNHTVHSVYKIEPKYFTTRDVGQVD